MTVIPDSIEPYLGYKALRMTEGHLVSPSQYARWPKKEPLESECKRGNSQNKFEWKLVPAPEGWEGMFWVSSKFLIEGATTTFSWPPDNPPEGFTWIPEEAEHDLTGCQCGIYVVDDPDATRYYLDGYDRVLTQVALWGQVVIGNKGARGQYAYPQRLFAAEQQQETATEMAAAYDIPLEIVRFFHKEND